jgi:DDE family transposase
MSQAIRAAVQSQVEQLRQHNGLPLTPALADPDPDPRHAPDGRLILPRQRLFTPMVTLWTFLAQIFCPDHSCRQALLRLIAHRAARGESIPSEDTGGSCKARQRLPEAVLADATRQAAEALQDAADPLWLWKGRHVQLVDGTTISMPDTPENQRAYPQSRSQKPGVGFPIARLVALISLATGAVLDLAMGPYQGKETGETALFRQLWDRLRRGDLILGDCYFGSYFGLAPLVERGVDALVRMHQRRKYDFGLGQLLGVEDHIVEWTKPERPAWMSVGEYAALPATLRVRELRLKIGVAGFRVQELVLVTTLLDAELYTAAELGALFRQRWNIELDLRAIKSVMQMDVLRCETPEMVRKEVWVHLLGYNLIRKLMSDAAAVQGCAPRELSFTGALQTFRAFHTVMELVDEELREPLRAVMLEMIGRQRVGDRPDRVEPRAVKRRPKPHDLLNKPRAEARKLLMGAN